MRPLTELLSVSRVSSVSELLNRAGMEAYLHKRLQKFVKTALVCHEQMEDSRLELLQSS